MKKITSVIILAAGEGKRMNSDIPKVLHLFQGVPMLARIIKTARNNQNSRISGSFAYKINFFQK